MDCLIVRKQWLDLILPHAETPHIDGVKTWEMRSKMTNKRGLIGLIEAGSGTVVGVANLVECWAPLTKQGAKESFMFHRVRDLQLLEKWNTPWVLQDAQRLKVPVKYEQSEGDEVWVNVPHLMGHE
jgi:hypothetical protein